MIAAEDITTPPPLNPKHLYMYCSPTLMLVNSSGFRPTMRSGS